MPESMSRQFGARIEPRLIALFRAAYRLTGNAADAEDLVQDTCLRAFTKLKAFTECKSPGHWLMRVQYNLFVDRTRLVERTRVRSIEEEDCLTLAANPRSNPEVSAEEAQREAKLLDAWRKLTKEQRGLLTLRAEGYHLAEISDVTGFEIDVLNARLHRARQSLARHLKDSADTDAPRRRMEIQR